MLRVTRAFGFAVFVALGATRAAAQAPTSDRARTEAARTLFEEGLELVDQERWQDAAERFRRALALRPSPVITFNLASALAKQGQVIEASELLRALVKDESTNDETRDAATQLLAEVERQIARLTIEVRGELAGHTVSLDARPLHAAEIGVALPVDPGSHRVDGKRGELALFSREYSLEPGASRLVTLDLPAASGRPVASTNATTAAPEGHAEQEGGGGQWVPWAAAGVVAVAVAVVVIVVVTSGGGNSGSMSSAMP